MHEIAAFLEGMGMEKNTTWTTGVWKDIVDMMEECESGRLSHTEDITEQIKLKWLTNQINIYLGYHTLDMDQQD